MMRKGHKAWNKGYTKDEFPQLSNAGRKKGCSTWIKGNHHTQETKDKIAVARIGMEFTKSHKKKIGGSIRELWKNPKYAIMAMTNSTKTNKTARPNEPEKKVIRILKSLSSNIKYVGDGTYWISGMNPDFVNEENKQIIEVFGCYWHCCKKCRYPNKDRQRQNDSSRISKFKALGYSVFVIWEHDLKERNTIAQRIQRFVS